MLILIIILISQINVWQPSSLGLFLLINSVILTAKRAERIKLGLTYLAGLTISLLVTGWLFGLLLFEANATYSPLIISGLITLCGLLGLKEYFWPNIGWGLRIRPKDGAKIYHLAKKGLSGRSFLLAGILSGPLVLWATGFSYLGLFSLGQNNYWSIVPVVYGLNILVSYGLFLGLILRQKNLQGLFNCRLKYRRQFRLLSGLGLVGLGWLVLIQNLGVF